MNFFLRTFFPSLTWKINTNEKVLYITFDDGPIPEVTPWVLDELKKYNAKATFFCVGDNIRKNPELAERLKNSDHAIGNHTMNHMNGWKNSDEAYFENVNKCDALIKSKLFRPPYGRIKISQIRKLKKDFQIVMWDVLSKDYDSSLSGENCFENVKRNADNGSVIVFHDSIKAEKRLKVALPLTLGYFSKLGFRFEAIEFKM